MSATPVGQPEQDAMSPRRYGSAMRKAFQLWFVMMCLYVVARFVYGPSGPSGSFSWDWGNTQAMPAVISAMVCYRWIKLEKTQEPTTRRKRLIGFLLLCLGSSGLAGALPLARSHLDILRSVFDIALSIVLLRASHKLCFQFRPKSRYSGI